MKRTYILAVFLFFAIALTSPSYSQNSSPVLKGPYLGQKPPGMIAEPFAPGIISKDGWELEGVFAPGMNEFYYTAKRGDPSRITVIGFRQENDIWREYLEFPRQGETVFSPDGERWHMAIGTALIMAGQSVKALAPCSIEKIGALCVYQLHQKVPMFLTTIRVTT